MPVLCKQLLLNTVVLYGVFHLSYVSWLYSCVWNKQVAPATWPLQARLWSFFFGDWFVLFCSLQQLCAANLRIWKSPRWAAVAPHTEYYSEKKPHVTVWSMSGDEVLILWSVLQLHCGDRRSWKPSIKNPQPQPPFVCIQMSPEWMTPVQGTFVFLLLLLLLYFCCFFGVCFFFLIHKPQCLRQPIRKKVCLTSLQDTSLYYSQLKPVLSSISHLCTRHSY